MVVAAAAVVLGACAAACNSLIGVDRIGITDGLGGTGGSGGHSSTTTTSPAGGASGGSTGGTTASGGATALGGSGGTTTSSTTTTTTTTTTTATTTTTTTTLMHECPAPGGQDCTPGNGNPTPADCGDGTSCFLSAVQQSVNATLAGNPTQFYQVPDHSNCLAPYDPVWFMDTVVAALQSKNLCARRDPPDSQEEVTVKLNNAYAENFDIVASWGCARTGSGIYTGFCLYPWW